MARHFNVPGLASVVVASRADEVAALASHPLLDRAFVADGRIVNRLLAGQIIRQTQLDGVPLDAFRPRVDARRKQRQVALGAKLDGIAQAGDWPYQPLMRLARFVADGQDRRGAEAALAYLVALPFLTDHPEAASRDDAFQPIGRSLWRQHRWTVRARAPLSPVGWVMRLTGSDRRIRRRLLGRLGNDQYGVHAVEITLANAHAMLLRMRRAAAVQMKRGGLSVSDLSWAAVRVAPDLVVRQSGERESTLPHVRGRVPPRTLVLLRTRRALADDAPSGTEFAAGQWSECPARRYVMALFSAVAQAAVGIARGGTRA